MNRFIQAIQHVFALFRPLSTYEQQRLHDTASHRAKLILSQLQHGEFRKVRQQFPWFLRWILPESLLRKGWELISTGAGGFVRAGDPVVSPGRLLTTAKVPVQFKYARLALVLSMTRSQSLVGLRFLPLALAGLSPAWQPPSYANINNFNEIELKIGRKLKVGASLTIPKCSKEKPVPCLILLAGSGPCDRDSTVGALKMFKDLAYGLSSQGIAVLRFDKVTFAHPRKLSNDTITVFDEYLDSTLDAISHARQHHGIDPGQVYILGHSLGAMVAPYIAKTKQSDIAGLILMAAPAQSMYRAAIKQFQYLSSLESEHEHSDAKNDASDLASKIQELEHQANKADSLTPDSKTPAKELPFGIGAPYWLSCRELDPLKTTESLASSSSFPISIMQGGRDYQVTEKDDFAAWRSSALLQARSDVVELRLYEHLNHAFVSGEGRSTPAEYETEGLHVSRDVVDDIASWVERLGNG